MAFSLVNQRRYLNQVSEGLKLFHNRSPAWERSTNVRKFITKSLLMLQKWSGNGCVANALTGDPIASWTDLLDLRIRLTKEIYP